MEGPGAGQTFAGLDSQERHKLSEAAEQVGLMRKVEADGSLTVYGSGDELVFGVVPCSFEELGLHEDLVLALLQWDPPLEKATHIQATAIPKILAGEDIVIQGETGSGKTLAYLLPAADAAIRRAEAQATGQAATGAHKEGEDPSTAGAVASCYRVEPQVGPEGIRCRVRPDEIAPFTRRTLRVGDEFVASSVAGSPLGLQFIEMANGDGWVPWDRSNMRYRLALSAVEFREGQRVEARERLEYASGDVVVAGTSGTVARLKPLIGVKWDGLEGVKAVIAPRRALRNAKANVDKSSAAMWKRCAPDTVIITSTRELCEQTAEVARKLGRLLPPHVQKEWTVAVAVGAPPGVGKRLTHGNEQWPFPVGDGAPRVLVTTLEFMGYFFHKKHVPLWGGIRYLVYDEVDRLVAGPERTLLNRVKVMLKRAERTQFNQVQSVLVCATMPTQGTKSTRLLIGRWMPRALQNATRPDLLHRHSPMVLQSWRYVPGTGSESFDEKVRLLVEYLRTSVGTVKGEARRHCIVKEKTLVFCNGQDTAAKLAERLATTHLFERVGLMVSKVGNDERLERLRMLRDGRIMLMVCTDILSRGIDIPDMECVVQFDFSRNITGHIHRIGRCSRAGTRGRAMNFYDDDEQGGRALAEAVQALGSAPLDGLFSRNRGFRRGLRRTEAFRDMLLMQGLPLPQYLQDGVMVGAPLLPGSPGDVRAYDEEEEVKLTTEVKLTAEDEEDLPESRDFENASDEAVKEAADKNNVPDEADEDDELSLDS